MFGLTRDFVEQGGTFMVLDRPEGLMSIHLSQVQMGMIRSSRIPNFLPMHTKELDFRVSLQYNITGKRMLSQALRGEKLSLTEFYGLLLQVATALNDSSMYMLRPTQYILDEEYIFIEGPLHLCKLYLTYVPLDKTESPTDSVRSSFKDFLTRLVSSVSELRGSGVQALMHYCNEEGFNLAGLKRLLIEMLALEGKYDNTPKQEGTDPRTLTDSMLSKSGVSMNDDLGEGNQVSRSEVRTNESGGPLNRVRAESILDNQKGHHHSKNVIDSVNTANGSQSASPLFPPRGRLEWESTDEELQEETKKSSLRTYWLLGGLLGLAAVWRFLYMNNPSQGMLFISIIGTVVIGAISIMGWRGKIGRASDDRDAYSEPLPMFDSGELGDAERKHKSFRFEVDKLTGWFGGKSKDKTADEDFPLNEDWRWGSTPSIPSNQELPGRDSVEHAHSMIEQEESLFSSGDYYDQLPRQTDMLSSVGDGGTVLLQPKVITPKEGEIRAVPMPSAFLEVVSTSNGNAERVDLHQPHFIIGRSAEVSQYVAQMVGTSRAHVELSRGADGYRIKDLGSRNGTILKGEPMVPYKDYPLEEGDIFHIAGGKYTFRAS